MKNKSSRNDLTIDESLRFRKLEKVFLSRCRHFGYNEIKTSTIEPLYIFTALGALSEMKLRRIYSFIDWDGWSGERVALKPDSTACVARFFGEQLLAENPRQKLCYVENHFEWADSWDEISERWQCGIENVGTRKPEADIEVIYMACNILREIGFKKYYLCLSYPVVNQEIINALSEDEESRTEFLNSIGKGAEKHSSNYLENLFSLIPKTGPAYEKIGPGLENFISVCKRLDDLEIEYTIDFSMEGDLEYYTGILFQILSSSKKKSGSNILCSGGRYDNYIKDMWNLSEPVPAVGFALYARNIIEHALMIEHEAASTDKRQNISIYICNITKHNVTTGQILCDKLSRLGFAPQITFSPIEQEKYEKYGLVLEVDHERFTDGYQILFSQKIGKPLLMNLFGEISEK